MFLRFEKLKLQKKLIKINAFIVCYYSRINIAHFLGSAFTNCHQVVAWHLRNLY